MCIYKKIRVPLCRAVVIVKLSLLTVFKNKLLTNFDAPKNRIAHENRCIKRPSHLQRFCSISLDSKVTSQIAPIFRWYKTVLYHLKIGAIWLVTFESKLIEQNRWRWLGLFMQRFSWAIRFLGASKFVNNLFLSTVYYMMIYCQIQYMLENAVDSGLIYHYIHTKLCWFTEGIVLGSGS